MMQDFTVFLIRFFAGIFAYDVTRGAALRAKIREIYQIAQQLALEVDRRNENTRS